MFIPADMFFLRQFSSGRLPYTIAKQRSDYASDILVRSPFMSSSAQCSSAGCENYSIPALPSYPKLTTLRNSVRRLYFPHINISHIGALDIDYRHFDSANIEPRYEFGYGMSYTTFRYSHLSV